MRNAIRLIALTIIAMLKAKLTLAVFCLLLGASAWAQGLQERGETVQRGVHCHGSRAEPRARGHRRPRAGRRHG